MKKLHNALYISILNKDRLWLVLVGLRLMNLTLSPALLYPMPAATGIWTQVCLRPEPMCLPISRWYSVAYSVSSTWMYFSDVSTVLTNGADSPLFLSLWIAYPCWMERDSCGGEKSRKVASELCHWPKKLLIEGILAWANQADLL